MGGQDGNTMKHILQLREVRKYIFFKGIGASANWLNYEYFNKPGLDESPPPPSTHMCRTENVNEPVFTTLPPRP